MINEVPFTLSTHQPTQTNYIQNVLSDPESFWKKAFCDKCTDWFKTQFNGEVFMLDSCTEAINLVASALKLWADDEVILPSFTHVSTFLPFSNFGIKPVFIDINENNLCLDIDRIEQAITKKTRAIIAVNYGGWSVDYHRLKNICNKHKLVLIEDNSHGLGATSDGIPLGDFGDFTVFSFERQKNINCHEGGALIVRNQNFLEKVTTLSNVGTNKMAFEAGEVDFFEWVDQGIKSSFTEFQAAYLFAQLEKIDVITADRKTAWQFYFDHLQELIQYGYVIPNDTNEHNGHVFYIILKTQEEKKALQKHLANKGIMALPHYYPLHLSSYGAKTGTVLGDMNMTEAAGLRMLRLPIFNGITTDQQQYVIDEIYSFVRS